jgi:hypothetical protein
MIKHKCDKFCSLCTATPPCSKDETKYCATCNRWFLIEECFQNHLILKVKGKLVCQWRQVCRNCSYFVTFDSKHECFKKFCTYCNKKQPSGHSCYVAVLKPSKLSNKYFTFSLIRSAHKTLKSVMGLLSMYRTSYVLSRCSKRVNVDDVNVDCEQCGKRVHTFWQDPVGKFIDYFRQSRPFADKIYVISHNSWIRRTVSFEKVFGT